MQAGVELQAGTTVQAVMAAAAEEGAAAPPAGLTARVLAAAVGVVEEGQKGSSRGGSVPRRKDSRRTAARGCGGGRRSSSRLRCALRSRCLATASMCTLARLIGRPGLRRACNARVTSFNRAALALHSLLCNPPPPQRAFNYSHRPSGSRQQFASGMWEPGRGLGAGWGSPEAAALPRCPPDVAPWHRQWEGLPGPAPTPAPALLPAFAPQPLPPALVSAQRLPGNASSAASAADAAVAGSRWLNSQLRSASSLAQLFEALAAGWQDMDCSNLSTALQCCAAIGAGTHQRSLHSDPTWGWLLQQVACAAHEADEFGEQSAVSCLASLVKLDSRWSPDLLRALRRPLARALQATGCAGGALGCRGLTQLLWCLGREDGLRRLFLVLKPQLLHALWTVAPALDAQVPRRSRRCRLLLGGGGGGCGRRAS